MGAPRYRLTRAWLHLGVTTLPLLIPAAVAHLRQHPDHRLVITPAAHNGTPRRSLLLDVDEHTGRLRARPLSLYQLGQPEPDGMFDPPWMTQAANTINALQGDP